MAQTSAHVFSWGHHQVRLLWRLPDGRHDVAHTSPPLCSPKFFRKITYASTLSELASYVPLTQIDIPPAVYQYVSIIAMVAHH